MRFFLNRTAQGLIFWVGDGPFPCLEVTPEKARAKRCLGLRGRLPSESSPPAPRLFLSKSPSLKCASVSPLKPGGRFPEAP